ncbi:MAG: pyruvate carboxylase subunit B [Burkholderiales bacterium]|nr:pyruvate carboxylase subunit B [Burkholderiales bacterium]
MREIRIADTTLRDAHQCLWATRMTTAMMLPVAEAMDRIGFEAIDLIGGSAFDVSVRYLKEDPWERIRLMRQKVTRTKMQGSMRSRSLLAFDIQPDDVNFLWLECLAKNGIRRVRTIDALCDYDNIGGILHKVKELGMESVGSIVYTHSPVHTDDFYAGKTKELIERGGVDVMMIKDAGGLLTPDRIRTLVPALLKVTGDVPLVLHSHCITGLAPLVYLEAVKLGVTQIDTSIAPLANGQAQPATQTIVRNLRAIGYTINIDDQRVDEVGEHFRRVAENEGFPLGVPSEYDEYHYRHQIPGGMMSNMKSQLQQAHLAHKLPELLEETARLIEDLGWPVMVTPFAQLVGVQALLNVVHGERYTTVPDEIKKYALGYYGKLVAPVAPDVLDRIVANGSPKIGLTPKPMEPAVPGLRKKYSNASDEERLLRHLYAGSQVDDMQASGATKTAYDFQKPIVRLLEELAKRRRHARICLEKGSTRLELRSAG